MTSWPFVLLPAVVIALVVRLDAKWVGPYFALSEVIPGNGGVEARYWYETKSLRTAFVRRLAYPFLAGGLLATTSPYGPTLCATVGCLAAGLMLWPVVFHGLPIGISRRDWEVPVAYVSFVLAYGALGYAGGLIPELVTYVAEGDVRRWLTDQFLGNLAAWLIVIFAAGLWRSTTGQLSRKAIQREQEAAGADSPDMA